MEHLKIQCAYPFSVQEKQYQLHSGDEKARPKKNFRFLNVLFTVIFVAKIKKKFVRTRTEKEVTKMQTVPISEAAIHRIQLHPNKCVSNCQRKGNVYAVGI